MTLDNAKPSAGSAGFLPLDQIIHGDNCEVMRTLPSGSIDLVVTSPPYDDLRAYGGHSWDFYGVAWNLKRLLKPGGVIVWVVADQTKDGSETGTSMRQALHFKDIGLRLHDTMIYHRLTFLPLTHNRYEQAWEYCFVFSRGKPDRWNPLKVSTKSAGQTRSHRAITATTKEKNSSWRSGTDRETIVKAEMFRSNIWSYPTATKCTHPAQFPESLARDHILSWSNEGDVVLDPFIGSGTTAKMARETGRRFIGIEVNLEYVEISRKRLAQQVLPIDGMA